MHKRKNVNSIEEFDSLFVGKPADIEKNLKKILPEAKSRTNKSIYLQILSQIALAQAMQHKFKLAHKTLDTAEKLLTSNYSIAQARVLLERGRVYMQAFQFKKSLPFFLKSYQFSKKHKLDYHASNAAHMIAFVTPNLKDKIKWNKISIAINTQSKDPKVSDWNMIDYNNLGSNFIDAKKYQEAISAYKQTVKLAIKKKLEVIALGGKWGIACGLRGLNKIDQALTMQLELLDQYNALHKKGILTTELLRVTRGVVCEELAEIYLDKTKQYAALAYQDLSKDQWMKKLKKDRIDKMKRLSRL